MNTTIEQPILCINITVLLRCMSHYRPVPCNELNTVAVLLEGSLVEIRAHITLFCYGSKPPGLLAPVKLALTPTHNSKESGSRKLPN